MHHDGHCCFTFLKRLIFDTLLADTSIAVVTAVIAWLSFCMHAATRTTTAVVAMIMMPHCMALLFIGACCCCICHHDGGLDFAIIKIINDEKL